MQRLLAIVMALVLGGCSLMASGGSADAPLQIGGVLSGKTVLRGHILVAGDLLVPAGSTLIIRPGTTLLVRSSQSTKIDPEFLSAQTELTVRGRLVVAGKKDAPVRFLPEALNDTESPAWAGIILDGATASSVRYAELVRPEAGLTIIGTSPDIIGNRIQGARYGIVVQGGAAKILDNEISGGEGGIFCWNKTGAYLKGNSIHDNDEEGIVVARGSHPYIDRNDVFANDIGLVLPETLPYDPVMIRDNRQNVLALSVGRGEGP